MIAEFDLIARIRARSFSRADVLLGIGDDAAVLQAPPGMQLVVATDTLNSGIHFPPQTAPFAIGWKALAVNLSDLAAMGAVPAWASLSLSLPAADAGWVEHFIDGFMALAAPAQVALIGGDTTRGPLSVCVSLIGHLSPGPVLRRDAAQVGDDVWVSGSLGDAAAALALWQAGKVVPAPLQMRLDCPQPRLALGQALRRHARAALDVSDGLLADAAHLASASAVGIDIDIDALPLSPALAALPVAEEQRRQWQAGGGDDYELCFTAPPAACAAIMGIGNDTGIALARIGRVREGSGVAAFLHGEPWQPEQAGYCHFPAGHPA